MRKDKLFLFLVIFLILPLVFLPMVNAFEEVGSDNKLSDGSDDVWHVVIKNGEPDSVERVSTRGSLDITEVSFGTSGVNYEISVNLKENYDDTLIEGESGSYIAVWVSLNGSTEVSQESAPLWCMIGAQFTEGYVFCTSGQEVYYNRDSAEISDNIVTWTFPQEEIKKVIPNTKETTEWTASAWSMYLIEGSEQSGEFFADIVGDAETEEIYQDASLATSIPGYSFIMLGIISISAILAFTMKIKYKKI